MKFARLSALSVAMVLASTAQANPLIEDGSFDIHLRNYYKNNKVASNSGNQWAQAISANYASGFFGNVLGFDLGGHYALKLKADTENANPGLLPVNSSDKNKSSSYGKTSYAVKVNLMDMGVAKYGRMFMDTPLLKDNYSRSLPSLTEAFYAEGAFQGASLYGIWATKANHRTESGFDRLMVNGKKQSVKVLGGGYDFDNGLTADVAAGQQSDYARRYYLAAAYVANVQNINVTSDFKFGRNSRIGFSKQADEGNSQNTWGLSVKADVQQASVGLSYQTVSKTDVGSYNTQWSGQDMSSGDMTGYFGPHDLMIGNFAGNGQNSWGINAGYNFAGMVDGFSVSAVFVKGKINPKGASGTDESEYNLVAGYEVPQVENLNLSALYGKNTKKPDAGNKTTSSEVRLIVKYDMSVF